IFCCIEQQRPLDRLRSGPITLPKIQAGAAGENLLEYEKGRKVAIGCCRGREGELEIIAVDGTSQARSALAGLWRLNGKSWFCNGPRRDVGKGAGDQCFCM